MDLSFIDSFMLGRVTYAPLDGSRWRLTGEASLSGLFSKVFSVGVASPRGFEEGRQLYPVTLVAGIAA